METGGDNTHSYLDQVEKVIYQCETLDGLSKLFKVNISVLTDIIKSKAIEPEAAITKHQKHLFFNYIKNIYTHYFTVKYSKSELLKQKSNRKSSRKLALTSIAEKQKILSKLEQGFELNMIGLFEELRIERMDQLNNEIQLLKQAQKPLNKKISKNKKPYARIIYTPMGGKVK